METTFKCLDLSVHWVSTCFETLNDFKEFNAVSLPSGRFTAILSDEEVYRSLVC